MDKEIAKLTKRLNALFNLYATIETENVKLKKAIEYLSETFQDGYDRKSVLDKLFNN